MNGNATGLATIEVMFPQETLVRVLVVDDDDLFLESLQSFFSSNNYSVDLAHTPEEAAQLLEDNEYELVIADINFGDLSDVKGDKFILKNPKLFGRAKRVVVTGEWLNPERYEVLKKAGIIFLGKEDEDFSTRLEEVAQEKAEERTKAIVRIVEREVAPSIQRFTGAAVAVKLAPVAPARPLPADVLKEELKQMFIEWLAAREDPDEPALAYGDGLYSAREMITQIEDETGVGLEHLRLLVGEIKYSLGLIEDDSQYEEADGDSEQ